MAKPRTKKINLEFVGTNAEEVTGSCIFIKAPNKQILLECGLYQTCGNDSTLKAYKVNNAHFKFKPKNLDYIFVNHCHVDHCGNLPKLYKEGCTAPFFMPKGSKPILEILLRDSARIMARDAEELSRQYDRSYEPIFTDEDVDTCLQYYNEADFGETVELDEEVKYRFVPSGHILNAGQLELWIKNDNLVKKIGYTSDLGNIHIEPLYANVFEPIQKCDYLIGESTYAGEPHIATASSRSKDLEKLEVIVNQTCLDEKARILIPSFANQRTQMILTCLYRLFGDDPNFKVPILVDSPMAIRICREYSAQLEGEDAVLWQKVMSWKNLVFVEDALESKAWRDSKACSIIVSSSGMLTPKTRALTWAADLLPRVKDRICFIGYSNKDSIASIIKEGKKRSVTIGGRRIKNNCQITRLYSFSSHMQNDSLLDYYSGVDCQKIILVHGDREGRIEFADELQNRVSKKNHTAKVVCSFKDYSVTL